MHNGLWWAGEEAAFMEKALGIPVVRHITKKPAGDAVDLEKHFRLASVPGMLFMLSCLILCNALSHTASPQ